MTGDEEMEQGAFTEELDGLYELWKSHTARHECLGSPSLHDECPVRHALVRARVDIFKYQEGNNIAG